MVNWQGYSREKFDTMTVPGTPGTLGDGLISIDNNTTGTVFRIYQVTLYCVTGVPSVFTLSKGINNVPTNPICSTDTAVPGVVAGQLAAAAMTTADGPPYVDLLFGESLIATCASAFAQDTFGLWLLYELGTLY